MRKRKLKSNIVGIGENANEETEIRQALVVGPESLREIIRFFKEKKSKKVIAAGGSGGANTKEVLKSFGYDIILNEENIAFVDLNSGPWCGQIWY